MVENDVVVIGCGVAGGICALKLLNDGFNVRIIDKNRKIGSNSKVNRIA